MTAKRIAIGGVLVLAIAVLVPAFFVWRRLDTRDLEAGLIRESFGELLQPHIDGLLRTHLAIAALSSGDVAVMKRAQAGEVPPADLPLAAKALVDAGLADALGALAATHARTAKPLPAFHAISDPREPIASDSYLRLQAAAKVVAIDMQRAMTAGRKADALAMCLDSLALARDASWGNGAVGAMIGAAIVGIARPGCAQAIDVSPLDDKRRAARSIETIRAGFRPYADSVREDMITTEFSFARYVPQRRRGAFPTAAQRYIEYEEQRRSSPSFPERVGDILRWRQFRTYAPAMAKIVDFPIEAREIEGWRIADLSRVATISPLPDVRVFDDKRRKSDAWLGQLSVLAAADTFRAMNGAWPPSTETLLQAGLLRERPVNLRTGATVECVVVETTFRCPAQPLNVASRNAPPQLEEQILVHPD